MTLSGMASQLSQKVVTSHLLRAEKMVNLAGIEGGEGGEGGEDPSKPKLKIQLSDGKVRELKSMSRTYF